MISVYNHKTEVELSTRRLELLEKYNKIIQYGRMHPVWFIENIFKIELLDYQKWVIMSSWDAEKACWVLSRNAGKSMLAGLFMMAKNLLFPSFETWIMSLTAGQAQDTFMKMENIAKHNISSIVGSSDVFINEVVRSQSNSDGFTHDKQSFRTTLFNGSKITSLVGKPESTVGKRSNLNVYDEAGKISDEFFTLTEPFTTQSTDFKTGSGIDLDVLPKNVPTQCLYMSSAEDTSTHLWEMYKTCARSMAMGKKNMFVADINCDIPLNPTKNGKFYPPLFKKSEVETALRTNEQRALREYYNIFDQTGGTDAIVGRDAILRNEQHYLPVFHNRGEEYIYGIFYDPALQADNSFVLVAEFFRDEDKGWMARLINGINLLDKLPNGEKKPLRSTEQLDRIRNLMVVYNGNNVEYKKLKLYIDPGSGGGGRIYSDFLMQDWVDKNGNPHKGVIDMEDETSKQEVGKFPTAIKDVIRLLNSQKYKNDMYAATGEMVSQDLVIFPVDSSRSGKIEIDGKTYSLSKEENRVFLELELLKEEITAMRKSKTEAGNIKYSLPPDKAKRMHDDRSYCLALCCYCLQEMRREDQMGKFSKKSSFSKLLNSIGKGAKSKNNKNPFNAKSNPFQGRNPFLR